jgi:hypothetical protein
MTERMTGTPPTTAPTPATGAHHVPTPAPVPGSPSPGTAEQAKEHARDVAATARSGGVEALDEAKGQAGEMLHEAKSQARNVAHDLKRDAHEQASRQTERAAGGLRGLAEQLTALVDGRPQEAGLAGDYARRLGDRVSEVADRMERGGFDGMLDDARRFARRRPGTFLLGAAVLGFATGRMLRAGAQANQGNGSASTGQAAPVMPSTGSALGSEPAMPVGGHSTLGTPPVGAVPVSPAPAAYRARTDR